MTYSLVNKDGEALGEEQTLLTLEGTILKLDENKYETDSTVEYQIKAETLECACNNAVFRAITISQKAAGDPCEEFE